MNELAGISASRGICIGPVFQFVRQKLVISITTNEDPQAELTRLQDAIQTAGTQIDAIYQKALEESSEADAEIFQAHKMILTDPELVGAVEVKIKNLSLIHI